jgi:DNA-binding NarL/FixJ family response regulator
MSTQQVARRVRTLIVDDDEDMRLLAASVIRIANGGLEVCGQAEDADDGYAKWNELRPDVVVLDHRMPGRSGLDLAAQILAEEPAQPIVLFSAYLDTEVAEAADGVGVCRTLDKDRFNDLPSTLWTCAGA